MKKQKLYFNPLSEGGDTNIIPIASFETDSKLENVDLPATLPVLALRDVVLFPGVILPITVGREKSLRLIEAMDNSTKIIGTVVQKDPADEEPTEEQLYKIGTVARIIKILEMPDGHTTVILHGIKRLVLNKILSTEPYNIASVTYIEDLQQSNNQLPVLAAVIKDSALEIIRKSKNIPQEAAFAIKNIENPAFLINMVAANIDNEFTQDKMKLLAIDDIYVRGKELLSLLNKQLEFINLKASIQDKVRAEMDQQQRQYFLNNQLKTIQEELGVDDNSDITELKKKAAEKREWPESVAKIVDKEITRLERSNPNTPDYTVLLNYIEFILNLPWDHKSKDNLDLKHAQKVLDKDHYGLDSVKDRIIEHLAVLKLKGDMKSPILCLYGPPGVGKTSLGKSIAKALGREYGRISLGGLHDEAEIRGHRRTYIGAMCGRILQTINKLKTSNPVIVLDEIDKVSSDYKGDPASALLEVLDPEQNTTFHDNYLDIDYDLSNVMFITTANNISNIHPALKDRMEMIQVSGYLAEEKFFIAKNHLIPKQRENHGLSPDDLKFKKSGIETIINKYTCESGVRTLDKQIAKVARNIAKDIAKDGYTIKTLDAKGVEEILGLPTNFHSKQEGNEGPGVVTGLAWTAMGGEILFIESSLAKGKGVLTSTGNLGDVMKESAMIAYQYVKAHAEEFGIEAKLLEERDIHIHVPEGATPKDGPSAGITIVSSIVSAFKGVAVKPKIAMTGEMTLRGKVLPVGGIKEKILAAKRAGINTILLSKENEKDINDIKDIYKEGLHFNYVTTMKDVIDYIF